MFSQPPGEPGNIDPEAPYIPGSNFTYHDWPTPVSTQFTLALKRLVECMIFPDNLARDMTEVNRTSHSPSLPTAGEVFDNLRELSVKATPSQVEESLLEEYTIIPWRSISRWPYEDY
eukprot:3413954-Heterocapsa_arctica.AAC.1